MNLSFTFRRAELGHSLADELASYLFRISACQPSNHLSPLKPVASLAHGEDVTRVRGVQFQLAAYLGHVRVHGAADGGVVVTHTSRISSAENRPEAGNAAVLTGSKAPAGRAR
jgi:hypothetical protein